MPRKTKRKRKTAESKSGSSRAIWKGSIDFGLVNIPVRLYSAENSNRLSFDLLDKRDFSRIRYRRVNETTGKEVPWDDIIKGYEYKKGEYVALSDADFARANVEATQTISITDFVDASAVSPLYYDKPYYLEPLKNGQRAYVLLREVLHDTGKVGIAKVVIRSREHLAMVLAEGPALILELLRFPDELRDASRLDLPKAASKGTATSAQEIKMAERLVESMVGKWQPEKYRDDYRDDLMKIIDEKVESGKTKVVENTMPAAPRAQRGKVIDIMHLLRESVEQASKRGSRKDERNGRRKAG
ncbi:MAG TPA: Ku protein [Candidatus Binatia bacterium]